MLSQALLQNSLSLKLKNTPLSPLRSRAHLHEKSTMGLTWIRNQTSRRTATGLRLELMHSELEA